MDKLLTVVVPVYNMEKYLDRCLSSLVVSNELMTQLEVIVINDGSTDGSLDIMLGYSKKYQEIFNIIDKKNGGHGSCWNVGLKEARGKYVSFLDSDDWYDNTEFCELLHTMKKNDVDAFVFRRVQYIIENQSYRKLYDNKDDLPYGETVYLQDRQFSETPTNFLYFQRMAFRTQTFREANPHFVEGISYDDILFTLVAIYAIKTVKFLNLVLYYYFIGRQGQSIGMKYDVKRVDFHILSIESLYDFYDKHFANQSKNVYINGIEKKWAYDNLVKWTKELYREIVLLKYRDASSMLIKLKKKLSHYNGYHMVMSNDLKLDYRVPFFLYYVWKSNSFLRRIRTWVNGFAR